MTKMIRNKYIEYGENIIIIITIFILFYINNIKL